MTEALYLKDSYLKTFEATVQSADGTFVVLDKTAFYPVSGGQAADTGVLHHDGKDYNVTFVKKVEQGISHAVDQEGLKQGDKVTGTIDWERRHKLMRSHTATHVLCQVIHSETGALITGNQLETDKSRMDFNLENFDRAVIETCFTKANEILSKNIVVKTYFMPKTEAMQDSSLVKLANKALLDKLGDEIRIVEIGDIDKQMDGGTHVNNLEEVGPISLLKLENKGKSNRRVYFTLQDTA